MKIQTLACVGLSFIGVILNNFSAPAQAAAITFDLELTALFGLGSGTGTATFDDRLLVPNQSIFNFESLRELDDFQTTFTKLAETPSITRFTLSDLTGWVLRTDSTSQITELNFFMRGNRGQINADGYSIQGVAPFTLQLFTGSPVDNSPIAGFRINLARQTVIYEPSSGLGLLALAVLTGTISKKIKS